MAANAVCDVFMEADIVCVGYMIVFDVESEYMIVCDVQSEYMIVCDVWSDYHGESMWTFLDDICLYTFHKNVLNIYVYIRFKKKR